MSKYNPRRRKKRILSTACYFIAFALLFGALVYLYKDNRNKKQERTVYKENLAQEESEGKLPEITTGEKKKEETVPSPTPTAEPTVTPTETPTPEPTATPVQKSDAKVAPTAEATPTIEATPIPVEKLSVLVLNGTRKQGVAGFWKGQLEAEGFTNVTAATYKKAVEAETVIYSETQDLETNEDIFKKLFPKAEFRQEGIKDGISFEANQGGQQESYDYYIVVGLNDARNK